MEIHLHSLALFAFGIALILQLTACPQANLPPLHIISPVNKWLSHCIHLVLVLCIVKNHVYKVYILCRFTRLADSSGFVYDYNPCAAFTNVETACTNVQVRNVGGGASEGSGVGEPLVLYKSVACPAPSSTYAYSCSYSMHHDAFYK